MRIAWSPDLGFPPSRARPAVVAGMQPAIDALMKANVLRRVSSISPVRSVPLEVIGARRMPHWCVI